MQFLIQDVSKTALFGVLNKGQTVDLINESDYKQLGSGLKNLFTDENYITQSMELCSLQNGEVVMVITGELKENAIAMLPSLTQVTTNRKVSSDLYLTLRIYTLALKLNIWREHLVEGGAEYAGAAKLLQTVNGMLAKTMVDPIELDLDLTIKEM